MPEQNAVEGILTEAQALANIVTWSEGRPVWQRDALHRLCQQETLTEQDITELTELCKNPAGSATPLSMDDVRTPEAGTAKVQLRAVKNAMNVNAIVEGQKLSFLQNGVTIVYGDNGSGKSGYGRILKKVCRARDRDEQILRNIYTSQSGPQRAEIDFAAGGQNDNETWVAGQTSSPLLSAVSVFDARTASVHVDATNDVAYIPFPIELLERLVHACRAVKGRLDGEINALENQTPSALMVPDCDAESTVGVLIAGLNAATRKEKVQALAALSDTEVARLEELTADFAQNATVVAHRLQNQKLRLDAQIEQLQAQHSAVSGEAPIALHTLWQTYEEKKEAARLAAQDLFAQEPLPDVGSEIWRTVWEAARAYSHASAYPSQDFPFTATDARCVLCQQELAPDGAARLQRFEAFVQDRTKKDELEAQHAFEESQEALRAKSIDVSQIREVTVFIRDELGDEALAKATREWALRAKWRLRGILRTDVVASGEPISSTQMQLEAKSADLGDRATALMAQEQSEERQVLKRELQSLKDRLWLKGIKDDVIAEIDRKKKIASLKSALNDTVHTQITNKSSDISDGLVTNALRGRFAQEIDRLQLAGLAIELRKTHSQYGVPFFRVSLIHQPTAKAGEILSEGEHRCVALAAFLAELSTTESQSGIVFDDPVSSLDHLHRDQIAARLAEEGQHRQVIVFTHDLAFLFLLESACRQRGTEFAFRHVLRRSDGPGHCANEAPLKAQDPERRVKSLQRHLQNTQGQHESDPEGQWVITAKGLLEQTREAWEGAIEAAIAPVLSRFSNNVDTKGFSKLSAIGQEDAVKMREGYGRCSILLHNMSKALNPAVPTPDDISTEIEALRCWVTDLKSRQDQIPIT